MEAIKASATIRFARISPQKTRLVADLIRGKGVEEAKRTLVFTQKRGADLLLKALNSAIANAEVKNVEDPEILKVETVFIDQGPVYPRRQPRARGRADTLRRPSSHVTLVVAEDISAKEEAVAKAAAAEAKRAKKLESKRKAAAKTKKTEDTKEQKVAKTEKKEAAPKKATTKKKEATPKKAPAKKKEAAPKKTTAKDKEAEPKKNRR